MNIDFHHTATYTIARMAGFLHSEAATVAYAAQYVDDATNSGVIRFEDGRLFSRFATAHRLIARSNWVNADNVLSWMPFHFIPGNLGQVAGAELSASRGERLACIRDSPLAREMASACIADMASNKPYALHRLGITAHVYADTWAHHGFVGMVDASNGAENLCHGDGKHLMNPFRRALNKAAALLKDVSVPGHTRALSFPDKPFLQWTYIDRNGDSIKRDNPSEFLEAADALFRLFLRFRAGSDAVGVPKLSNSSREHLQRLINDTRADDPDDRREGWLEELQKGQLGFPSVSRTDLQYQGKGVGSWKHTALGTTSSTDDVDERFPNKPGFKRSDWFMFHVAAKLHRAHVVDCLLPKYGLAL